MKVCLLPAAWQTQRDSANKRHVERRNTPELHAHENAQPLRFSTECLHVIFLFMYHLSPFHLHLRPPIYFLFSLSLLSLLLVAQLSSCAKWILDMTMAIHNLLRT